MTSPRPSTLGLLPIPEHRRRRILPLLAAGVVAIGVGVVLDIPLVWSIGAGIIVTAAIALLLDRRARRTTG